MSGLTVTASDHSGVAVATLAGDVDLVNHESALQDLLRVALDGGPRFVVDLAEVGYVDSNGVRMLFALAAELSHSRIEWAVSIPPASPIVRLLKVTAFDEVADLHGSLPEALAAVERGR